MELTGTSSGVAGISSRRVALGLGIQSAHMLVDSTLLGCNDDKDDL